MCKTHFTNWVPPQPLMSLLRKHTTLKHTHETNTHVPTHKRHTQMTGDKHPHTSGHMGGKHTLAYLQETNTHVHTHRSHFELLYCRRGSAYTAQVGHAVANFLPPPLGCWVCLLSPGKPGLLYFIILFLGKNIL